VKNWGDFLDFAIGILSKYFKPLVLNFIVKPQEVTKSGATL